MASNPTGGRCCFVGIPFILEGRYAYYSKETGLTRRNLFHELVKSEHEDILQSSVMHAVITFKWETYGQSIFYVQVGLYFVFLLTYEAGLIAAFDNNGFPTSFEWSIVLLVFSFFISLI